MGKITIREKIGNQIVKAMGDTYSVNDATNYILRVLRSEIAKLDTWNDHNYKDDVELINKEDVLTLLK